MLVLQISKDRVPYTGSFLLPFSCDEWAQRATLMGPFFPTSTTVASAAVFAFSVSLRKSVCGVKKQVDGVLMSDECKKQALAMDYSSLPEPGVTVEWSSFVAEWASISSSVITSAGLFVMDLCGLVSLAVILLMTCFYPTLLVCLPETAIRFTFWVLTTISSSTFGRRVRIVFSPSVLRFCFTQNAHPLVCNHLTQGLCFRVVPKWLQNWWIVVLTSPGGFLACCSQWTFL